MAHLKITVSRHCCSFVIVFQWLSCSVVCFYMVGIGIPERKNGSVLKDAKMPLAFSNFSKDNNSGNNSVGN